MHEVGADFVIAANEGNDFATRRQQLGNYASAVNKSEGEHLDLAGDEV